jgi:hypothetical protein
MINWQDYQVEGYTKRSDLDFFDTIREELGLHRFSIRSDKYKAIINWYNTVAENIYSDEYQGMVTFDTFDNDDNSDTILSIAEDYTTKESGTGYKWTFDEYDDGYSTFIEIDDKKCTVIFYKNHEWKDEF